VRKVSRLPVYCYNIPQYSGNEITLEALQQMLRANSVDGIKDSTGKPERLRALLETTGGRIPVYAASDSFALASRRMGAHGFISALANIFPEAFVRIWNGRADGRPPEAAQSEIDRIRTAVKGYGGISALKYLAFRRGFDFGCTRLPFTELDDAARRAIDAVLEQSALR
jgi:4-hydroxy-tetrahydrodipicolinate synthase